MTWLLDGRQRRTALSLMRDNPVELYDWARSYIKFAKNADPAEVSGAYWEVIEKYLEQDSSDDSEDHEEDEDGMVAELNEDLDGEGADDDNDLLPHEERDDKSFKPERQRKGLKILLDLILMVHAKGGSWAKLFDFTKFFSKLSYAPVKQDNKVDPIRLRKFLLELGNNLDHEYDGNWGKDEFIEYYVNEFDLKLDNSEKLFHRAVDGAWDDIRKSIDTIKNAEKIFSDMRIGVVRLSNVSPLDAQNIFSRVNQGGTQLKAEELLSAKPYWNKPVLNVDSETKNRIHDFYRKMNISIPEDVVRWDLAATLIDRIADNALIFTPSAPAGLDNEIQMDRIAMGFKLLSAMYIHGISNKSVIELEGCDKINWEDGLSDLLHDLNIVVEIIRDDDFFNYVNSYRIPLCKLLGNAPAMEFLTIMWHNWLDLGCPKTGKKTKILQRNARLLFDKLTFEYAVRIWRGSSDSKLARDVSGWEKRLEPIPDASWKQLITQACDGVYNGQSIERANLRPVVVYSLALQRKECTSPNSSCDVDHIIPQTAFVGNENLLPYKDGLANLCMLPRRENEKKGGKPLKSFDRSWLGKQIAYYSGIDQDEFHDFSSVASVCKLIEKRKGILLAVFENSRKEILLAE